MGQKLKIAGRKFNRLQALKETNHRKNSCVVWLCVCDCGNFKTATSSQLRVGKIKSCGCLKEENPPPSQKTHGLSYTAGPKGKEYRSWAGLKSRCLNKKDRGYKNYGGRGIKVCQRWQDSFEAFLEDMGKAPTPKHSIDRIDCNGNYEPQNCRWATYHQQANNRRSNRYVTLKETGRVSATEAARILGKDITLIRSRLKRGWSDERAFYE